MIQAVVESHVTHNRFYPVWTEVKDAPTSGDIYPCVWFKQYTGRLIRDDNGWYRIQYVEVLVMTSSASDRTSLQLQQDVEAADKAATNMVLKIDKDYDYELDNVVLTTMADEGHQLQSGVILRFTCKGEYECIDPAQFPEPEV